MLITIGTSLCPLVMGIDINALLVSTYYVARGYAIVMSNYQLTIRQELSSQQGRQFFSGYNTEYVTSKPSAYWDTAYQADVDQLDVDSFWLNHEPEDCGDCQFFTE